MRFFLAQLLLLIAIPGFACSLEVNSETYKVSDGGSGCVNISSVRSDTRGQFRAMELEETSTDGEFFRHPTIALRPGTVRALKVVEVPVMGRLNVVVLRATDINTATLSFLNGNTITMKVDANGNVSPEKICVKQVGLFQVRGYVNACP